MLTPVLPSFTVPRLLDRGTAALLQSANVALFVALMMVSLAVAGSADRVLLDHASSPAVITAVIPQADEGAGSFSRHNAALRAIVSDHEHIALIEEVDPATTTRIAQTLLGEQPTFVPRLVDLVLKPASLATAAELERELDHAVPGITLVDGNALPQDLRAAMNVRRSASTLAALSLAVLLIGLASLLSRIELAWHDRELQLLHLLGATDSFVARTLARDRLRDHLRGAGLGLVAGCMIIVVASSLSVVPLPEILAVGTISPRYWIAIGATALLSAPLVTLAAHLGTSMGTAPRRDAVTGTH